MIDDAPADDPAYTLMLELDRLEALREDLLDGDTETALAELTSLGLASPFELSARISTLHHRLDKLA